MRGFLLQGEGEKIAVCPWAHKIFSPKHCGKKTAGVWWFSG